MLQPFPHHAWVDLMLKDLAELSPCVPVHQQGVSVGQIPVHNQLLLPVADTCLQWSSRPAKADAFMFSIEVLRWLQVDAL